MILDNRCPFCGSLDVQSHYGNGENTRGQKWHGVWIECMEFACGAQGPRRKTATQAWAAWRALNGRIHK